MKLIELKLKNIKTYVDETIKFSDGINCILGLNGSGKSSIIESIGYVLFNYSQRTSNNLLRYNETKGSISLKFIGNDDITYQIIRNIRSKNSSIKIINVENNQVLYENVSDVYAFVKKILNIPKEKSLSKMFEEIIAVPQGTFVNAFLDTPKNRKENFDKLFELDIYKTLGDNTKKLIDILDKQYIYELEKEKSLIEGQLFDYDNKVQEKNKLIEYDKELEKEKNNSFLLYNKKEEEKYRKINDIFLKQLFKDNKPLMFFDVDNTITNYGKLSEEKRQYIKNFNQKDRIILSTGKAYEAIMDVVSACELQDSLASCLNGSVLAEKNKFIMLNGIGNVSKQLIEEIEKTDIEYIYYYVDGAYSKKELNEKNTTWMQKYNEYYTINENIDFDKVIKILTFVFDDEKDKENKIKEIADKYQDLVSLRTGYHCYEILRYDQHKGNTVKLISEKLGKYYRLSIGVGDSMNDLKMLEYVGKGYVVDTVSEELGVYNFEKLNKNRDIDIVEIIEKYK